jgi:hypothetical protein
MPTEPSVMIQVFSLRAFRLVAMSDAASPAGGALARFLGEAGSGPLKFLERLELNFFSILLAGGLKVARTARKRANPGAAF